MTKITDKKGREWAVEIDVVTVGRVRKALDINLLELVVPGSDLPQRLSDPVTLVDVLYVLCQEQAEKHGVGDVDFGRSLSPDAIENAGVALLEGVVNFSPSGTRPAMQKVLEKAKRIGATQEKKVQQIVESPEFDVMLDKAMMGPISAPETMPSESTGDASNLPESPESSPAEDKPTPR